MVCVIRSIGSCCLTSFLVTFSAIFFFFSSCASPSDSVSLFREDSLAARKSRFAVCSVEVLEEERLGIREEVEVDSARARVSRFLFWSSLASWGGMC